MRSRLIETFIDTDRGKNLPDDCIKKIKNILYKDYSFKKNMCVMWELTGLGHSEYLDGAGYICSGCLYYAF